MFCHFFTFLLSVFLFKLNYSIILLFYTRKDISSTCNPTELISEMAYLLLGLPEICLDYLLKKWKA